jgi:hypothetical protein
MELNDQISSLTSFIHANRFLEIGDDPSLVEKIEHKLVQAHRQVKSIQPFFNLDLTPLSKANVYFALIKDINDALVFLQEVRKRDYGSREHTRELLEKLEDCAQSIYAVGDLVGGNTEQIH